MGSLFAISSSGLAVASQALAVSADDVANVLTEGFVPGRVEARELPGGGVSGEVVRENDPAVEARLDGIADLSGTDLLAETVRGMRAAASFRASLASLRSADEALGALLDVRA
jgi:flagellar basal body rod protein FlgC